MGGDDSQKLLPWRGIYSSPGRKPPAHYEINTVTETAPPFARPPAGVWLSYRLPGSFLASTGGSVLARAEAGGELEQIQLLLGHASVQTTERYLGTRQDLVNAPNDGIKLKVVV